VPVEWFRTPFSITSTDADLQQNLAVLSPGQAIRRCHFGWTANAVGNGYDDLFATNNEQILAGLVTTVGDGTEFPPDPLFQPENQDPPTQRWLWWEARAARVDAFPQVDTGAWSLSTVDPAQPTDAEGQVLVPQLPSGQFLRLWFIAQSGENWPFQVPWYLTGWASVLVDLGNT
jgi:hypothetical protein